MVSEYEIACLFKRLKNEKIAEAKADDIIEETIRSVAEKIDKCPKCVCGGFAKWRGPARYDYHELCGGEKCENLGNHNGLRTSNKAANMATSHRMKKIWEERKANGA